MTILYHGTSTGPFDRFDLSHILEGDGKVKFGYGIYLTSRFETAAHYSFKDGADRNFVYTVELPDLNHKNTLGFKESVNASLRGKIQEMLGLTLPNEVFETGAYLRKYLANYLSGNQAALKSMISKTDLNGEKKASFFLSKIGILALSWPVSWIKPQNGLNYAILSPESARIKAVEEIMLDARKQYVDGSRMLIKTF